MKSIKWNMLIMMISLTVIPMIILSTFIYIRTNEMLEGINDTEINQTKKVVTYYFDQKLTDALTLAQSYTQDETMRAAFSRGDREALFAGAKIIFDNLETSMNVSVFEFGDKSGTVFLRVHNPEKYGDDKSKNSGIAQALKGDNVKGFEYGSSGLGARVFVPIENSKNEIIGTLQIGFNLNEKLLDDIGYYVSGDIAFYNEDVLSVTSDENYQDQLGVYKETQAFYEVKKNGVYQNITKENILELYMPVYESTNTEITGMIGVYQDISQENTSIANIFISILIFLIIVCIIVIIIALIFSQSFTLPIKKITAINQSLAKGDLSIKLKDEIVKYLNRKDEIGVMANAVQEMTLNLRELLKNILSTSEQLTASSEQLTATSQQSATATEEVAQTINEIAKGANEQAESTTSGAEKLMTLGGIIEDDKKNIYHLMEATISVSNSIKDGLNIVEELESKTKANGEASRIVYESILRTNESSSKINEASRLIASIADQTNLLALNAAIEAARAGEHGKGFAVVAEEIRKLAEQSNNSTKNIDEMVKKLIKDAETAVKKMEEAGNIVKEQEKSVDLTRDKFNEISSAMKQAEEMATMIEKASRIMDEQKNQVQDVIQSLSAVAEENAASTEEASAAIEEQTASIEEISNASENLSELAIKLRQLIKQFRV